MIALGLALLCVLANAFFVAAEFAFAKVRPSSLEALARAGDKRAVRARRMLRQLDGYLATCQLGITLASLGLGWLGEPAVARFIAPPLLALGFSETVVHSVAFAFAFSAISLLHIVVGELVPKTWAIQRPERVSRLTAAALHVFYVVTWPPMWVLNGLSNFVLRMLGLPFGPEADAKLTADEIRVIIQGSFGGADVGDRKRDLLERVLRGTDRPVRAIMVPRVDIVAVAPEDTIEHAMDLVRTHGYSRYPLCENGEPDQVVGYVHVKDVLTAAYEPEASLRLLKRDVLFVPESTKVGDLLSEFQLTHIPIAIVVDEYGGTDGLVTVEDVVEEMVGEIQDEHDSERPRVTRREDGTVVVDGTVSLGELDLEGLEVSPVQRADSVAGYVVERIGRLPWPGDRVRSGGWDVVVEDVRRRRVARAAFVRRTPSEHPDPIEAPPPQQ